MIDPKFECAMCKRDLMATTIPFSFVIIDGNTENICRICKNKFTPDEIKSVTVQTILQDKTITKEYDLILFLTNQFIESDISNYTEDNHKLTKYLRKLLGLEKNEDATFQLKINLVKKRCNKCDLCEKLLDFEDSIYFKTGKQNSFIQVCRECEQL